MNVYAAVFVLEGSVRQVTFEAESPEEAKLLAQKWGLGVTGEARSMGADAPPKPEAYDFKTAGVLLSGNPEKPLSISSIRRLEAIGKLSRLPNTCRFLITRKSLERYCGAQS